MGDAGETHELGFGNRHALAREGQIHRALPDDGICLTKPGGIVHRLIRSANPHFYPLRVNWQSVFRADSVRSEADHDEVVRWRSRQPECESAGKAVEKLF